MRSDFTLSLTKVSMHFALLVSLGAAIVANAAESRNVLYYDQ
jgi:hypothetical protein